MSDKEIQDLREEMYRRIRILSESVHVCKNEGKIAGLEATVHGLEDTVGDVREHSTRITEAIVKLAAGEEKFKAIEEKFRWNSTSHTQMKAQFERAMEGTATELKEIKDILDSYKTAIEWIGGIKGAMGKIVPGLILAFLLGVGSLLLSLYVSRTIAKQIPAVHSTEVVK